MERRQLTQAQIDEQYANSTRIAPGIWEDAAGHIHYSIPELLALVDLEDTPENHAAVIIIIHDMLKAHGFDGRVVRQDQRLD